jgi:hypothetical protein
MNIQLNQIQINNLIIIEFRSQNAKSRNLFTIKDEIISLKSKEGNQVSRSFRFTMSKSSSQLISRLGF